MAIETNLLRSIFFSFKHCITEDVMSSPRVFPLRGNKPSNSSLSPSEVIYLPRKHIYPESHTSHDSSSATENDDAVLMSLTC